MGYRNYIAPISKTEYEKIKNMTLEELYEYKNEPPIDEDGYVGVYDICDDAIYGLGKYVDEFDNNLMRPFFLNEELQKHMTNEHDFYLVGKDFLKAVIDRYKSRVQDYYNKMCSPFFGKDFEYSEFFKTIKTDYNGNLNWNYSFDFNKITQPEINALKEILEHIRSMRSEWVQLTPYNLEKGESVTTSWKYEYAQFELVRIYKTFDWDNYHMVYYGY